MEKLPLLVHGKPITDYGIQNNVGMEQRLRKSQYLNNRIEQDHRRVRLGSFPEFLLPDHNFATEPQ